MNLPYRIYQLFITLPFALLFTIINSVITIIGCTFGNGHFWGYYPSTYWGKLLIRICLLPVKTKGHENLNPNQSYVFVSNHQGAFDIFLIYGYLNRNFKWMMKKQIGNIPLIGMACKASHQIFVDKSGHLGIKQSYEQARKTLQNGMSLVVFPEGSRTLNGKMGSFKRGAYMLADELQLPIVPITLNGPFQVMPRQRDMKWVTWHPLSLTIHAPIPPSSVSGKTVAEIIQESRATIMQALPEKYQD